MKTELEWLREIENTLVLAWRSSETKETFDLIDKLDDKVKKRIKILTNEEEDG